MRRTGHVAYAYRSISSLISRHWGATIRYGRISQSNEVRIGFEATPTEVLNNTEELMRATLAPLYELFELYMPSMQMIISETAKLKAGRF